MACVGSVRNCATTPQLIAPASSTLDKPPCKGFAILARGSVNPRRQFAVLNFGLGTLGSATMSLAPSTNVQYVPPRP